MRNLGEILAARLRAGVEPKANLTPRRTCAFALLGFLGCSLLAPLYLVHLYSHYKRQSEALPEESDPSSETWMKGGSP